MEESDRQSPTAVTVWGLVKREGVAESHHGPPIIYTDKRQKTIILRNVSISFTCSAAASLRINHRAWSRDTASAASLACVSLRQSEHTRQAPIRQGGTLQAGRQSLLCNNKLLLQTVRLFVVIPLILDSGRKETHQAQLLNKHQYIYISSILLRLQYIYIYIYII